MTHDVKETQLAESFRDTIRFIITHLELYNTSLSIFNVENIILDDSLPYIAALKYKEESQQLKFIINSDRFDILTLPQKAFVVLHETLHYVLQHPIIWAHGAFENEKIFITSCDIIINDLLIKIFHPNDISPNTHSLIDNAKFRPILGKDYNITDASEKSLIEIYNTLAKRINTDSFTLPDDNKETYIELFGEESSITQQVCDTVKDSFINNIPQHEENNNQCIDIEDDTTLIEIHKVKIKCDKIINKLTGHNIVKRLGRDIHEYTWTRKPKSRINLPDDCGIIPDYRPITEIHLNTYIFIDISSSVSKTQLQLFMDIFKSLPRFEWGVRGFLFNTEVLEIFLDNLNYVEIQPGGGTRFNCIIDFLNTLYRYPDYIIIITDGGSTIDPNLIIDKYKNLRNWKWLLDDKNSLYNLENVLLNSHITETGEVFNISDLLGESVGSETRDNI